MTVKVILFYLHSIERSPISLYNCKATTFELVRAKINMQKIKCFTPYSFLSSNLSSIIR